MAAQRTWAWDFEEMRSAGVVLDDHDGTYAAEYDFEYCQYTFRQLVLTEPQEYPIRRTPEHIRLYPNQSSETIPISREHSCRKPASISEQAICGA